MTMFMRGALGNGCVLIRPGDKVTYYDDPEKVDLVRARVHGYPDFVYVPHEYIRIMQHGQKNKN